MSVDLIESRGGVGFHPTEKSYSAAPFIVYRSAKYSGIRNRSIQVLATYGRFYLYLVEPLFSWCITIRNLLYEIFGFLLILAISPVFIASFIGLFLLRKLRIYIIRRFHKDVILCEDLSPRCYTKTQSEGMVTFVLWAKGHIDTPSLSSYLETRITSPSPGNLSILSKTLSSRYTLRVWESPSTPFSISQHVVQAPSKFYSCLITDDSHDIHGFGGKSDRSILQKYVTSRASVQLDENAPPWQVTIIPLPSTSFGSNRTRTCVVLRFHRFLMQEDDVVRMLVSSMSLQGEREPIQFDLSDLMVTNSKHAQKQWISGEENTTANNNNNSIQTSATDCDEDNEASLIINNAKTEVDLLPPVSRSKSILRRIRVSLIKNYSSTLSDLKLWLSLRKKQYQFHSKLSLSKSILVEIYENSKQLANYQIWQDLKSHFLTFIENLRALSYIPFLICETFIKTNYSPGGNNYGFKWNGKPSTRHVSWSKPISSELLTEISNKTENSSTEAIVLMACSLALRDYYSENCISNPKTVGVTVTTSSKEMIPSYFNKALDLSTRICDVSSEIKNLTCQLGAFPTYKQLGSSYFQKWSSYFLPRSLTYLVFRKLFQRYPLSFTFIDTESPFPNMSLWGQTIDEFTFSRSPQSDFCISITLVKYAGSLRLSVLSPMKSIDSVITRRFCQHLNQIAETVGVPRNKIPYSRKSSPTSSSASSPYQMRSQKSCDLFPLASSSEKANDSRISNRYGRCQSLLNITQSSK